MIEIGNILFADAAHIVEIKDKSGDTKAKYVMGDDFIHHKYLMKENYIEFSFNLGEYVPFIRSDYFILDGWKFIMRENPEIAETASNFYKYTLKFEGREMLSQDIGMYYVRQGLKEFSWSLFGTATEFAQIAVDNINRYFGEEIYSVGTIDPVGSKLISFDSSSVWDALISVCDADSGFECEFYFDADNSLNIVYKYSEGIESELETDVTISKMDRSNSDNEKVYNRIVALGSTRNIPNDYRTGQTGGFENAVYDKRLRIPVVYGDKIDAYENMTPEEVSEGTVVFDDIYPKRIGIISSVSTKQYTDTDEDTGIVTNWNAYRFKDSGLTFSKDYVIAGKELRIVFQSGNLNGCDFAVKFNPDGVVDESASGAQLFEIVRNDDYGVNLPNDTLKPIIGDTYVLYGFDTSLVSEVYLPAAEQELYDKATEWLTSNLKDKSTFSCPTIIREFAEKNWNFDIGRNVKLIGSRFANGNRSSRIMGFEKKLINPYDCTYTVGDNATYSRIGTIEKNVDTALSLAKSNSEAIVSLSNIKTLILSIGGKNFLSKINPDTAAELIGFIKGLDVGTYTPGTLGGGGTFRMKDGNSLLEVDKMVVRKDATFRTWIVQEVIAQGGEIVISAANPIKCTSVSLTEDGYRCFFDTGDGQTTNTFHVGDQARCQIFTGNKAKYYWRLVTAIGANYIDLSGSDKDGNGVPAAGDNIVQLGNRTDASRQKALVLSAISSDFLAQYEGINTYSLVGRRKTHIGSTSEFVGTVKFSHNGEEVDLGTWASGTESSIQDIKVGTINLIRNADFSKGLDFWDYNNYGDVVPESQFGNVLETDNSWTIDYEVLRPAGVEFCWSVWIKSTVSQICTITVNSESYNVVLNTSWQKFSGKHISNGSSYTSVLSFQAESASDYISIAQPFYAEGNRPGNFSISPQDLDDKIGTAQGQADAAKTAADNLAYLRELIDSSTEIDGGRVLTALLGVRNAEGAVTAFINGLASKQYAIGAGVENFASTNPSLPEKIASWIDFLGNAKFGNLRIGVNGDGTTWIEDTNGVTRFQFSVGDIPALESLIAASGQSSTVTNTSLTLSSTGTQVLANSIVVNNDGSEITVSGTLTVNANSSNGFTDTLGRVMLINSSGNLYGQILTLEVNASDQTASAASDSKSFSFKFTQVPAGTYSLKLQSSIEIGGGGSGSVVLSSTSSVIFFPNDNRAMLFGADGISLFFNSSKWLHVKDGAFSFAGNMNIPGILLAGNVSSSGGGSNFWGAKKHASLLAAYGSNTYTVYHSIGHSNYTVQVTALTALRIPYVLSKSNTSFTVQFYNMSSALATCIFDFIITGNNIS